jgi:hypothetical protein
MTRLAASTSPLLLALLVASGASARFALSFHDFAAEGWSGDEICVVCHAPQTGEATAPYSPLWKHEPAVESFPVYSSVRVRSPRGDPTGVSKLCLSCHDGTVARDSFGKQPGGTRLAALDPLLFQHPVSIVYDSSLAEDQRLRNPMATASGLGGTIAEDLLVDGRLECTSCHDIHTLTRGSGSDASSSQAKKLTLVKPNYASKLCLTCHNI